MIIVCDIDCVLNNLCEKMLEIYNAHSGKNIQVSDITSYDFKECLPKEDADALYSLFKEKELWDSLEPIKDSQWGLQTLLNTGHQVVLATATHECNFEWKCKWIYKHFGMINESNIIRIYNKGLLRADVIIDDCMDNLIKCCCDRICLDMPYNRDDQKYYVYDIYRARDWKEIVKFINDIERKNKE